MYNHTSLLTSGGSQNRGPLKSSNLAIYSKRQPFLSIPYVEKLPSQSVDSWWTAMNMNQVKTIYKWTIHFFMLDYQRILHPCWYVLLEMFWWYVVLTHRPTNAGCVPTNLDPAARVKHITKSLNFLVICPVVWLTFFIFLQIYEHSWLVDCRAYFSSDPPPVMDHWPFWTVHHGRGDQPPRSA